MRASASDAPCARERGAWLQPDQSLPSSKCVRRAGHRLDCKTATADVGKRVAAEEHQVGVALVDPERDFSSVVQISKLHTSETLLVPLEISERMVEPCRADPSRRLKIVFRVIHGFRADRKTALVGSQDSSPGYAQNQIIDSCGPERQVRMSAASVGTRVRAEVPDRCPHPESAVRQRIFDANPERERIARLRVEDVFHHRPVWLALDGGPGGPTDEAVDCIAVLRLVQRELVALAVELVAAILKPVRPRDQYLTSAEELISLALYPSSSSRLPAEYERSPPPTSTTTA